MNADRVTKMRLALLDAIPEPPEDWPVGVPFIVNVHVKELEDGEFMVTAIPESEVTNGS